MLEDMPRTHHASSNFEDRMACLKGLRQESLTCVEKLATTKLVMTDERDLFGVGECNLRVT